LPLLQKHAESSVFPVLEEEKIGSFFESLCSSSPTPGGGAVGGLCAASAAALGAMVASLSQGEKYAAFREPMVEWQEKFAIKSLEFLKLGEKDAAAFQQVIAAYRIPKENSLDRGTAIRTALQQATLIPIQLARGIIELAPGIQFLAKNGNRNVLSDVGVASSAAETALASAHINVLVNLMAMRDQQFVAEMHQILQQEVIPARDEFRQLTEAIIQILEGGIQQ
jgi:formiminotetrahydrofolate cyclodeaminase